MSRIGIGQGIVISSHGYVETPEGAFVSVTALGFDQFGQPVEDERDEGFVDYDFTWPGWHEDPRLVAAAEAWEARKRESAT